MRRTSRPFAVGNQPASWVLKSAAPVNVRPGRNEVSRNRLARSTIPLDSGSNGLTWTRRVASTPVNPATPAARAPRRPIPASLSQTSRLGTPPNVLSSIHIPANRSPVVREGSIIAVMNLENEATITSTGSSPRRTPGRPRSTCGNHRSHCT